MSYDAYCLGRKSKQSGGDIVGGCHDGIDSLSRILCIAIPNGVEYIDRSFWCLINEIGLCELTD